MIKLNAAQLRHTEAPETIPDIPRHDIVIVVDDVLDTYNVGSIFRLADAVSAKCVYLCGQTLAPPNPRIKKASVNTWQWVAWEHRSDTVSLLKELKAGGYRIIAVEQDEKSVPYASMRYATPLALVVGNETHGIGKEVLAHADGIVELPMWGVNRSLNVMVSLGIALYEIMRQTAALKDPKA